MSIKWLLAALLGILTFTAWSAPGPKKFAVVHLTLSQSEDGAPVATSYQFIGGETVFVSCQVEGYTRSPADRDENRDIRLSYLVEAKDTRGNRLQETVKGKIDSTISIEDKDWMPKIRATVVVPPLADTGNYQVTVRVADSLAGPGGAVTESTAEFAVKGRDVAPSDTLAVRNFRFLRSEEEVKALKVAAYRPGDAVWARFDMTGYKMAGGNQFDIGYGLKVLREDGTVAYEEQHAADLKQQPFYPQRYQPGVLSLNLAKDQKLGEYTIVLAVRDNIGNQTCEVRQKFSVE